MDEETGASSLQRRPAQENELLKPLVKHLIRNFCHQISFRLKIKKYSCKSCFLKFDFKMSTEVAAEQPLENGQADENENDNRVATPEEGIRTLILRNLELKVVVGISSHLKCVKSVCSRNFRS